MAINFANALSIGSVTMTAIIVALVRYSMWHAEKHKDDDKKTEKETDSLNRPGFDGGSDLAENGAMNKSNKFSPEVRERAVRMVQELRGEYPSLWAAVESIAPKIGCSAHTLLEWVRRDEVDAGGDRPPIEVLKSFVDAHRYRFGVEPICKVLQIAPSGYRLYAARQRNHVACTRPARCTVERLMRRLGLRGVIRGKVVRTTIPDAKAPCPLDRVHCVFQAERPNQLWVSNFT